MLTSDDIKDFTVQTKKIAWKRMKHKTTPRTSVGTPAPLSQTTANTSAKRTTNKISARKTIMRTSSVKTTVKHSNGKTTKKSSTVWTFAMKTATKNTKTLKTLMWHKFKTNMSLKNNANLKTCTLQAPQQITMHHMSKTSEHPLRTQDSRIIQSNHTNQIQEKIPSEYASPSSSQE